MPLWVPNTFGDPGQDSGDFGPKIGGNHPNMIYFSGTKRYYCSQSFSNRAHATLPPSLESNELFSANDCKALC